MWEYKGGIAGIREWGKGIKRLDKWFDNKELWFREKLELVGASLERGKRLWIKVTGIGNRKENGVSSREI
jgi:hypothetical protein